MLDEHFEIHSEIIPPPPPPPKQIIGVPMFPLGLNPLFGCLDLINKGEFSLKKTEHIQLPHKRTLDQIQPKVSLSEILDIRKDSVSD